MSREFDVSPIGQGAIELLFIEIERVYWNVNQEGYDKRSDPKIPGITIIPYNTHLWMLDPDEATEEQRREMDLPNLTVEGHAVEIRWYKHRRRGLKTTVEMTPNDWSAWLELALDHCVREECRHDDFLRRQVERNRQHMEKIRR